MVDEIFCPNTFDEYLSNTTGTSSSQICTGIEFEPVPRFKRWEDACRPKKGEWVHDQFGSYCSRCGLYAYMDKFGNPWESDFCPNCGMDLRKEEKNEI